MKNSSAGTVSMDAALVPVTRRLRSIFVAIAPFLLVNGLLAASIRTENFTVTATTEEFAQQVGQAAEVYRRELAIVWTGKEMPRWSAPCPITVKVGSMGAGGATTFNFDRGEVYGWKMTIQGPADRLLDSVLPHEINHTIFACYFRRPLPRWADEGAASFIEHESERMRLQKIAQQAVGNSRKIPLKTLLSMKDYPQEMSQVLTMYGEGYTLATFLLQRGDKPTYLKFLQLAHEKTWETALRKYYGFQSIADLETEWDGWMIAGCPDTSTAAAPQLAANDATPRLRKDQPSPTNGPPTSSSNPTTLPTVRGQNPTNPVDPEPAGSVASVTVSAPPANRPGGVKLQPTKRRELLEHPVIHLPHPPNF